MTTTPCGRFIWYELMTSEPNAAAAFYGAVVGWRISTQPDLGSGGIDYRHILRSDGGSAGGVLHLDDQMRRHGARPGWLTYLHVADVDASVRAIQADGGVLLMPAFDLPVGRIALVADPLGAPFYVMAPKPPPGASASSSDVFDPVAAQRVRWNELSTSHPHRAKAFYTKHFAFEFRDSMPMRPGSSYDFIDHAGLRLGAVTQLPETQKQSAWLFYIGVPSITAAESAVPAAGGRILHGPHQVPGDLWILIVADPEGVAVGLVGPKSA
jgi:predicted enzyme related to lactoylglutathione lyase